MTFNVLTLTLRNFITTFAAGSGRVTSAANGLLASLIVIDVVLIGFWWALDGGDRLSAMFKKLLHLGFWIWMVRSFPSLSKAFVDSLTQTGGLAGGGSGGVSLMMDPSRIAGYGLDATEPLAKKIADLGVTDVGEAIIFGLSYLAIIGCFLIMAVQVFVAVLEYYLITTVVGIFVPFGLLPSTKFLAEKAIGAVVAAGIKLMTMSFILSSIEPVLHESMKFSSPDIPLNELFAMFLTICGLMFLTWKAPHIASSLMSGSPNLGGHDIATPVMSAVGAAVGATYALMSSGASMYTSQSGASAASALGSVHPATPPSSSPPAASSTSASSMGSGAGSAPAPAQNPSSGSPPPPANRTLVMSSNQLPTPVAPPPRLAL